MAPGVYTLGKGEGMAEQMDGAWVGGADDDGDAKRKHVAALGSSMDEEGWTRL